VRSVLEEEMELALGGKKTAAAAIESAVKRGNELLRRFEQANR
jgi:sn-glycerol 3-phosphate transport system substrate-binding protein